MMHPTPESLQAEILALIGSELGSQRSEKAIFIVPPEVSFEDLSGLACSIYRVPTGARTPYRPDHQGHAEVKWDQTYTVYLTAIETAGINLSNEMAIAKAKMENHFRGRLTNGQGRYLPPSSLNREQITFEIVTPLAVSI